MDRAEHSRRLRDAIATSTKYGRADIVEATGRDYRTVSNWVSRAKPMMPSDKDRATLRRMFPGYDAVGDQVIVAIAQSELDGWRKDAVKSEYRRHLAEQQRAEESA